MRILIAGVSGNIGQACALAAVARGHEVVGMGRDEKSLPKVLDGKLARFVQIKNYWDIPALEDGCKDVEAVIAAYPATCEFALDAQLLLFRAADRAGIKRFHGVSWNYDWTKIPHGQHEPYAPNQAFAYQAAHTSETLIPTFLFCGALADYFFRVSDDIAIKFPPSNPPWNYLDNTAGVFGPVNGVDGADIKLQCTTFKNAGEASVELITGPEGLKGGFYRIFSFEGTPRQFVDEYHKATGKSFEIKQLGTKEDLDRIAFAARANGNKVRHWDYIGLFYAKHIAEGDWNLTDIWTSKTIDWTTREKFFAENAQKLIAKRPN